MSPKILVLGATGLIGHETARLLLAAGHPVRVMVRDPSRAQDLRAAGAEVVTGDLSVPPTLDQALDQVGSALLVSTQSPDQVALQANFVASAAKAGRPTIVKLSGFMTGLDSAARTGRWHAQTEAAIEAAGLPSTFLRAPYFMQNLLRTRPHAVEVGEIALPTQGGQVALVDARDIASVAAACLTGRGHVGRAYLVTGPEALTFQAVADRLSACTGKKVTFRSITANEMRSRLEALNTPQWRIGAVLEFFAGFEQGLGAEVTGIVREVTGTEPRRLEDYLGSNNARVLCESVLSS